MRLNRIGIRGMEGENALAGEFAFVLCDACDMNCDGQVDALDIEPFLRLLFAGDLPCNSCTGDVNGDGRINAEDIEQFLVCLFGP